MKAKNVIGKIYVSPNANLGHSEAFVEYFVEPNCSSLKAFYPPYTIRYRSKKDQFNRTQFSMRYVKLIR